MLKVLEKLYYKLMELNDGGGGGGVWSLFYVHKLLKEIKQQKYCMTNG